MDNTVDAATPPARNSVALVGRVSSAPVERELPSGSRIASVRVVVRREPTAMTKGSKQVSDWVDCTAWGGRERRAVRSWQIGDLVEIEGALRRRFLRGSGAGSSLVEIEVLSCRRRARAE